MLFSNEKFKLKHIKAYGFSSSEVIEIQSEYFYNQLELTSELGFETLVELENSYSFQIYKLIKDLSFFFEQREFRILELGGGTGKFYKELTKLLTEDNISFSYTIVDVASTKYGQLKYEKHTKHVKMTFNDFSNKNKENFDIFILNEALDMWAGNDILLDMWEDKEIPIIPCWVLHDHNSNMILKKKDVSKIKLEKINDYLWKLIYMDKIEDKIIDMKENSKYRYKIKIPKLFYSLLSKINLLSVIHDYWSFSEESNPLRVQKTVKDSSNEEKVIWVEQNSIPFGKVDVTYSPDQTEFIDYLIEQNLHLSNLTFENKGHHDDMIYYFAEKNKEIFLLYTEKAISKISGRGIDLQ